MMPMSGQPVCGGGGRVASRIDRREARLLEHAGDERVVGAGNEDRLARSRGAHGGGGRASRSHPSDRRPWIVDTSRPWRPSSSSPRARSGRRTTASASATCCAAAATASSSSSRSRSPGTSRRRASRSGSCASARRPRSRGDPGPVLEGLHPRHRAAFPPADDRAARAASSSRPGRRSSTARSTSTTRLAEIFDELAARCDRRGQRRRLPRDRGVGHAVGADRVVQPAGAARPDAAARLLRLPGRRPTGLGRVPRRAPAARTATCGADFDAVRARRTGRRAFPSSSSCTSRRCLNLYVYPEEVDYERAAPLAPTWHRLECSVRTTDDAVERAGRARRPTASSST